MSDLRSTRQPRFGPRGAATAAVKGELAGLRAGRRSVGRGHDAPPHRNDVSRTGKREAPTMRTRPRVDGPHQSDTGSASWRQHHPKRVNAARAAATTDEKG